MRAALLAVLLALAPAAAAAPGETAAPFLLIAPGARQGAMGGAAAGAGGDALSAYYNPAGLGYLEKAEVAAGRENRFAGLRYDYAVVSAPVLAFGDAPARRSAAGVLALSLYSLAASGIERRGAVETDAASGSFGASDRAYALSYAYAPGGDGGWAAGVTLKRVSSQLDSARASANSADLGLMYRAERWSAGVAGRNMTGKLGLGSVKDPLPRVLAAGGAYRPRKDWLLALDVEQPSAFKAGAEWSRGFAKDMAGSLRAGVDSSRKDLGSLAVLSLGGGIRWGAVEASLAWRPGGLLGDSFTYSLSARF
jgi:hypothetical protein